MDDEGRKMRNKQMKKFERLLELYEEAIVGRYITVTKMRRRRTMLIHFVRDLIED